MGATQKVLAKAGWAVSDVDLWEVNEAFAVVPMALMKELGVPHDKVNVNGGACALGHPIGASGARILVTLMYALQARGLKKGLATLCIGGGEATAVALARCGLIASVNKIEHHPSERSVVRKDTTEYQVWVAECDLDVAGQRREGSGEIDVPPVQCPRVVVVGRDRSVGAQPRRADRRLEVGVEGHGWSG